MILATDGIWEFITSEKALTHPPAHPPVCLPGVLLVVGEDSCSTNSENDLSVTV